MITQAITRQGKIIHVLAASDLDDPLPSGKRLRAFCPIHGSDTQRSLSVDATSGWGFCHNCHATVLVEEYAPDIAVRLRYGRSDNTDAAERISGLPSADVAHPSPPSRLTHTHFQPARPSATSQWQRQEQAIVHHVWPLLQQEACSSRRARAYLDERGIPPEITQASGIGYLSRHLWEAASVSDEQRALLKRWLGRIIFPLVSPDGHGFIGRSLWYWEPGMNENQHKAVLEARGIRRWVKTNPAGWFGLREPSFLASAVVLVEGGFDRLSLMAARLPANMLLALVGTAARPAWLIRLAPQVRSVVLALDADEGGMTAMERLANAFRHTGLAVALCPPPHDAWGKDWSERYRRIGQQCVWPLYEALASLGQC
jgi:hypothetical protein